MKRKDYEKPTMKIVELQHQSYLLTTSGVQSERRGYGTASTDDDTEQTWD